MLYKGQKLKKSLVVKNYLQGGIWEIACTDCDTEQHLTEKAALALKTCPYCNNMQGGQRKQADYAVSLPSGGTDDFKRYIPEGFSPCSRREAYRRYRRFQEQNQRIPTERECAKIVHGKKLLQYRGAEPSSAMLRDIVNRAIMEAVRECMEEITPILVQTACARIEASLTEYKQVRAVKDGISAPIASTKLTEAELMEFLDKL